LLDEYNVAPIKYHFEDIYEIPEGTERWVAYYGLEGTPNTYFDGVRHVLGAWPTIYDVYLPEVQARLGIPSPMVLDLRATIGATEGLITATVTLEESIDSTNVFVHFAVIEDSLFYFNRQFDHVLRDLLANEPLSISQAGESVTIDRSFTLAEDWNAENLAVVVFIQNDTTHEVYQARKIDVDLQTDVAIHHGVTIPPTHVLHQNYPNPFNPVTQIPYDLSHPSHLKLSVYDVSGKLIKTLLETTQPAGEYSVFWDGTNQQGHPVGSGLYMYQLETERYTASKYMILLK